ncbi:phd finger domain protein [Grosmannia clavigera kw1407]|uniref:Phd finger domain protein n=1 Tax=Grosmannia clavigera (strain kw1407 / UAMH 11150) TaxID=655863 RepID=F0XPW1_GROCL|nr:phd finger domain protein [Grosmannia clavigera kw1407]EFX00425.1 phd finger domain protein [Grosmannia clavigera kw1407]
MPPKVAANTRATRSRYSSPQQPTAADVNGSGSGDSSSSSHGNSSDTRTNGTTNAQRAMMARWLEPPVLSRSSFEEAGFQRRGVFEGMAPLGTLPKASAVAKRLNGMAEEKSYQQNESPLGRNNQKQQQQQGERVREREELVQEQDQEQQLEQQLQQERDQPKEAKEEEEEMEQSMEPELEQQKRRTPQRRKIILKRPSSGRHVTTRIVVGPSADGAPDDGEDEADAGDMTAAVGENDSDSDSGRPGSGGRGRAAGGRRSIKAAAADRTIDDSEEDAGDADYKPPLRVAAAQVRAEEDNNQGRQTTKRPVGRPRSRRSLAAAAAAAAVDKADEVVAIAATAAAGDSAGDSARDSAIAGIGASASADGAGSSSASAGAPGGNGAVAAAVGALSGHIGAMHGHGHENDADAEGSDDVMDSYSDDMTDTGSESDSDSDGAIMFNSMNRLARFGLKRPRSDSNATVVNKEVTDKVVEMAVDEALSHSRYPTAFALRTLYDEQSSNQSFLTMVEDVFQQTADAETLKTFARLIYERKKDGRKDDKGYYYFVPPSTESQSTPPPRSKTAPYGHLVTMRLPGGSGSDETHASKRVKLTSEPADPCPSGEPALIVFGTSSAPAGSSSDLPAPDGASDKTRPKTPQPELAKIAKTHKTARTPQTQTQPAAQTQKTPKTPKTLRTPRTPQTAKTAKTSMSAKAVKTPLKSKAAGETPTGRAVGRTPFRTPGNKATGSTRGRMSTVKADASTNANGIATPSSRHRLRNRSGSMVSSASSLSPTTSLSPPNRTVREDEETIDGEATEEDKGGLEHEAGGGDDENGKDDNDGKPERRSRRVEADRRRSSALVAITPAESSDKGEKASTSTGASVNAVSSSSNSTATAPAPAPAPAAAVEEKPKGKAGGKKGKAKPGTTPTTGPGSGRAAAASHAMPSLVSDTVSVRTVSVAKRAALQRNGGDVLSLAPSSSLKAASGFVSRAMGADDLRDLQERRASLRRESRNVTNGTLAVESFARASPPPGDETESESRSASVSASVSVAASTSMSDAGFVLQTPQPKGHGQGQGQAQRQLRASTTTARATRSARKRTFDEVDDNDNENENDVSPSRAASFAADEPPPPPPPSSSRLQTPVPGQQSAASLTGASALDSRGGTPGPKPKRPRIGPRVKTSPMKRKTGTSAGMPRPSGERASPSANGPVNSLDENDDYCASCGGSGELVCCDGCTRSFHFNCVDPPLQEGSNLPDEWFCNVCASKRNPAALGHHQGVLGPLLNLIEKQNSSAFSLPDHVRDRFEGVKTGAEGEYEDIVAPGTNRARKRGYEETPDFFRIRDAEGRAVLCHSCDGFAKEDRPIIPCAFCSLWWHIDCLDPPLANPPVLRNWRCPAHVDDLLAKLPGLLGPAHRFRKIKDAAVIKTSYSRGLANNGFIELNSDDESDSNFASGVCTFGRVHRISAKGVKLDFLEQTRKERKGQLRHARINRRMRHLAADATEHRDPSAGLALTAPSSTFLADRRSIDEAQAIHNLSALTAGSDIQVDRSGELINALLAQADPTAIAMMAQGSALNIETGSTLSQGDRTALAAMRARIDRLLGLDVEAPEIVMADASAGRNEPMTAGVGTSNSDYEQQLRESDEAASKSSPDQIQEVMSLVSDNGDSDLGEEDPLPIATPLTTVHEESAAAAAVWPGEHHSSDSVGRLSTGTDQEKSPMHAAAAMATALTPSLGPLKPAAKPDEIGSNGAKTV